MPKPIPALADPTPVALATYTDLKSVYLTAFDNFATDPSEIADSKALPNITNHRYARELLGILVNADIVTEETVNGEEQVWQTCQTYDAIDRDTAIKIFERAFTPVKDGTLPATRVRTKPSTVKSNPADLPYCTCGCGTVLNGRKSMYRPGHDARHAGEVARAILADPDSTDAHLAALPTDALRAKARNMVTTRLAKTDKTNTVSISDILPKAKAEFIKTKAAAAPAKPAKSKHTVPVAGVVKIAGREYAAGLMGSVVFYAKKDGSEVEVAIDSRIGKTFTPNA